MKDAQTEIKTTISVSSGGDSVTGKVNNYDGDFPNDAKPFGRLMIDDLMTCDLF